METKQSVRVNSMEMDEINKNGQSSTLNELHQFMNKYEELDKDRKKYMICFFVLFALVIIFLVVILIGLTANSTTPPNIDTCHSECTTSDNDFVTMTESDTDTPIATYNGWLEVYIEDTNLTNYTRHMTSSGQIIYDLKSYLYSLKQNLSVSDDDADIFVSLEFQAYRGNIDYNHLVKSCAILYTG